MSSLNELRENLKAAATQLVLPIQTRQPVDHKAFQHFHAVIVEIMRQSKGMDAISKSLLHEIRTVTKILWAEAPHSKADRKSLEEMAGTLEMCFDQLLLGETPEDRRPGVPRIL